MFSSKRSSSHDGYTNELDASAKRQKTATAPIEEATSEGSVLEKPRNEVAIDEEPKASLVEEATFEEPAFEEAGRQAMIVVLKSELDKLYSDFDMLVHAGASIDEYATFTKEVIRDGCLRLGGADCLGYIPEPAKLEEIVDMFIQYPNARRTRQEGLSHLNDRLMYDFVSAIDEGHAVLWKLKMSVDHAITIWSVWNQDAITKALQQATPPQLLHISKKVGVRIGDQSAMLFELLNSSDPIIEAHRRFRSNVVCDALQYKRSQHNEDYLLEKFDRVYFQRRPRKDKVLAAVQKLYAYRLGEIYTRSSLSTQLFRFEKFMQHKQFDIWREAKPPTPVNYLGHKAIFRSFYSDLMSFPVIARQLPQPVEDEKE
ncbi:hypothetical protein N431DRAFT_349826 [Stipitochalara longipes BDJ]|nr:hypothetical protein N431DRAFT_349826 [Stipitochalara longipes BDJ]